MTKTASKILIAVNAVPSFRMQRALIAALVRHDRPIAILHTGSDGRFLEELQRYGAENGVQVIDIEEQCNAQNAPPGTSSRTSPRRLNWRSLGARWSFRCLKERSRATAIANALGARVEACVRLLKTQDVGCILCSEDGISSEFALMTAASRSKVKVIDVPFGNATTVDLEFDLQRRQDLGELIVPDGLEARLISMFAPQWVKHGRFEGAVLHQPEVTLAFAAIGVPVRDAWIIHGGASDILCAENEVGLDQYRKEGIPESKLRLTGSPYCDIVYEAAKRDEMAHAALLQPRRIAPGRLRVLVSWPPSYHETYPGRSEFTSYQEMTLTVLGRLAGIPNVDLTVSLHPSCDEATRDALVEKGISVSEEYLVSLFGLNDVFVTYFSSTIRWALAAGKPVLNYDAYKLDLRQYEEAPGFKNLENLVELSEAVSLFASLESAYSEASAAQIANAARWGVLDGNCCDRIIAEIDAVAPEMRPYEGKQDS